MFERKKRENKLNSVVLYCEGCYNTEHRVIFLCCVKLLEALFTLNYGTVVIRHLRQFSKANLRIKKDFQLKQKSCRIN